MRKGGKLKFLETTEEREFVRGFRAAQLSFLVFYNAPSRDTHGQNSETVPCQLYLLSHPFLKEQADKVTICKGKNTSFYGRAIGIVSDLQKQLPV